MASRPKQWWAQRGGSTAARTTHSKNRKRNTIAGLLLVIAFVRSFSFFQEHTMIRAIYPGSRMPNTQEDGTRREREVGGKSLNFSLTTQYQNPRILREGCSVTVLLMDPTVGKGALWTLESVADYIRPLETACILIQTSICQEEGPPIDGDGDNQNATSIRYWRKAKRVEDEAQPLFRQMLRQGNVRMTVLNHSFYQLASCENFFSPSDAWQNWHFWGPREFVDEDSDLILTVQDDAVLCRPLDIRLWQDAAWVGAPWIASKGELPWEYCSSMPSNWVSYHKAAQKGDEGEDPTTSNQTAITIPPYPSPDQLCSDNMVGLQGNGGLSFRQRSWLRRAIEYCPTKAAGIDTSKARCNAHTTLAEDIYFVNILKGVGAPLPSAYEAALFVWESQSIGEIMTQYGVNNETWKRERLVQRWGRDQSHLTSLLDRTYGGSWFVPIGIHKPWSEFFPDKMCDAQIHRDCKYLRHIVHNSKSGMKELALMVEQGNVVDSCF